jgi:hypothetical protein
MDSIHKTYINPGETVVIELAFSEVCMHMKVAGDVRPVRLQRAQNMNGTPADGYNAQILNADGTPFSFPITTGEAGLYADGDRFYTYLPEVADTE